MSVNSHCHCFETRRLRTHQVLHLFPPLYNPWWVEGFNNEKFGVKNTTWAPNHYTISSAVATAILCGGLVPSISSQLLCHPLTHLVRVQYNQVYPYQLIYQSRLQWDWKYHHSLVYMLYHPILQSALWHRHLLVMVWGQLRSYHYLNSPSAITISTNSTSSGLLKSSIWDDMVPSMSSSSPRLPRMSGLYLVVSSMPRTPYVPMDTMCNAVLWAIIPLPKPPGPMEWVPSVSSLSKTPKRV